MNNKQIILLKKCIIVILTVMAVISLIKGGLNGLSSSKDLLYYKYREALFDHSFSDCQFPSTFWMIFFLGLFPETTARVIWLISNLAFTGIIVWALRKTFLCHVSIEDYTILILLMISGGAWRTNLSNGQHNLAAIAFFLLAVSLSEEDRDFMAGLLFSMSLFKYQVIIPLGVFFLYKRKYRLIVTSIVVSLVSLVGSAIWFGGLYNATFKQFNYSLNTLSNKGDVDIESVFGLGDYTVLIFSIGILVLVYFAYSENWRRDDTLFVCWALFVGWATAYQRIYGFFCMIVPLGYAWYKAKDNQTLFYKTEFVITLMLTIVIFWFRTISDSYGLFLTRVLFYPTMVLYLIDMFIHSHWMEKRKAIFIDV